jgi:hypothetical protein
MICVCCIDNTYTKLEVLQTGALSSPGVQRLSDDAADRRILLATKVELGRYGYAAPEIVIRVAGLDRVSGYRALRRLEHSGVLLKNGNGLRLTFLTPPT